MTDPAGTRPIVFFDGVCGLCNGFVDRLMRWDKSHRLRFATLQGTTASTLLPAYHTVELRSIVFHDGARIHTRSTAAIRIMMRLGGAWKLVAVLLIVPSFLRNLVYDLIARKRYSWFGKRAICRLPTPEEKEFFLP